MLKHTLLVAGMAAAALPLSAQENYSGYFLENYVYRHQLNPAFTGCEHGFVGMPGIGNLNFGLHGNLDLTDVLYNLDGRTVLFTNPGISSQEALSKFDLQNKIEFGTRLHVINFGFSGIGGFNTVGINVVAAGNVSVPYSLFELAKEGVANQTYELSGLQANAMAYAEVSLNHSHNIRALPGLRIGATVKFLIGAGNLEAKVNQLTMTLGKDKWTAQSNAELYASVKNMSFKTKYSDFSKQKYVSGIDIDKFGIDGFGVGFDIGAQYRWNDFNFSAALLDLGFINYSDTHYATTGDQTIDTDAFYFTVGDSKAPQGWSDMRENLLKLVQLTTDNENLGNRNRSLTSTLNVGVDYTFPLYRKLNFGLLSSTRFCGDFTRTQMRVSANVHPAKAFSASVNGVFDTFGVGFGWMLNLHTKGFNLFLGMDQTFSKLAKQGVPLGSNAQVNFGMNFPF
ncbi:MAG: hypothetical protein K2O24_07670 [Muribaculaceae bacterium]|nr:hypothetical protein [Muribaculaceae bacterium]